VDNIYIENLIAQIVPKNKGENQLEQDEIVMVVRIIMVIMIILLICMK
jgi:hypothetical protein